MSNDKNVKMPDYFVETILKEECERYHRNRGFCRKSEFDLDGGFFLDLTKAHRTTLRIRWEETNVTKNSYSFSFDSELYLT